MLFYLKSFVTMPGDFGRILGVIGKIPYPFAVRNGIETKNSLLFSK